jgi:hypothetical protein
MSDLKNRIKRLAEVQQAKQPKTLQPVRTFLIVSEDGKHLNEHYAEVEREAEAAKQAGGNTMIIYVTSEECKQVTERILAGEIKQ